ncbi:MAG TPA: GGDEF domain-containing protein [Clostridia bacterium]|nr:GGDEF domain-containing protein [Clostridia bacterium]
MCGYKGTDGELYEMALLVADNVDAMLAYWDKNCICKFANQTYQLWFGKSRNEILGIHIKQLMGPALYEKDLAHITEVLNGRVQVFEREIPLPSGEIRHSLVTYTPHLEDGVVKGFFALIADSSLLKKVEKELEIERAKAMDLATHDFLTGLPNRILLEDRFGYAAEHAEKTRETFSVMCMDLDNFKVVNDKKGHNVGDRLLKEIAGRMTGAVRETDTLTRIGGDEFILLTTNIKNKIDAEIIAKRVLDTFNEPFEALGDSDIRPGVSIGIAFYPQNGISLNELIKSSDNAMYIAKNSGKNRYEFV